jgi:hypothetical protein
MRTLDVNAFLPRRGHVKGSLKFVLTDAGHVYLGTDAGVQSLRFRGVDYHVSLHLFEAPGGKWGEKQGGVGIAASRHDILATASAFVADALRDALVETWNARAADPVTAPRFRELQREAEKGDLDERVARERGHVNAARQALADAEARLDALVAERAKLA